jgi:5-(carboxyamino)imidazole ribonucleotide mutase
LSTPAAHPLVGIVMGSTSDWEVMQHAARSLADFGVAYEARALSAHRTPDLLIEWVEALVGQGAQCFIAGAGGAAHLAGVVAAKTTLPVLAVPIPSRHLQGLDSLLSMVQMPRGIPVATFAIGDAGSANAGLFAVAMLALSDESLAKKLAAFRQKQADAVRAAKLPELK